VLLTNVGTLGFVEAFAPIPPITHAQIVASLGMAEKRAVVEDD